MAVQATTQDKQFRPGETVRLGDVPIGSTVQVTAEVRMADGPCERYLRVDDGQGGWVDLHPAETFGLSDTTPVRRETTRRSGSTMNQAKTLDDEWLRLTQERWALHAHVAKLDVRIRELAERLYLDNAEVHNVR